MNKNSCNTPLANSQVNNTTPKPARRVHTGRCRGINLARLANRQARELQRSLALLQSEMHRCAHCSRAGDETPGSQAGCARMERCLQQVEAILIDLHDAWMG